VVLDIEQTSWHFEEFYHPYPVRKIRSVIDILTDESEMPLDLKAGFVGLKIVASNAYNTEIASLNYSVDAGASFDIIANLGQLDVFPAVPDSFKKQFKDESICDGLKHVRLQIEYTSPAELVNDINLLSNWFAPKRVGICEFSGEMQPEFSVTLPKGWVISGDSVFAAILDRPTIQKLRNYVRHSSLLQRIFGEVGPVGNHFEGRATALFFYDSSSEIEPEKAHLIDLEVNKPYIKTNDDGRYTYQYLIKGDCYKKFRNWIKEAKKNNDNFSLETVFMFQSELSREVRVVSYLQYAVLVFSLIIFRDAAYAMWNHTTTSFNSSVAVAYLAGLITLAYFYADLTITEKYDIPHRLLFAGILIFSIVAVILNLIAPVSLH
jgi:hypothetical protein